IPVASLDHLVSYREKRGRHGEAEHAGDLCVNGECELARLRDRQVRRLRAPPDVTGVRTDLAKRIRHVRGITHQPTRLGKFSKRICRRDGVPGRQVDQLDAPAYEKWIRVDEKRIGPLTHEAIEGCIDLATGTGLENQDL